MGVEEVKGYMIGVVLAIVMVTGGILMFNQFKSSDLSLDSSGEIEKFNKTINKANEISLAVNAVDNSIQSVSGDSVGVLGWFNALIGGAFNGLRAISGSLGFVKVAATDTAGILSLDPTMVTLSLLVITIIIGFAIYAAIMRINT